jgi:hypothetical protein
MVHLDGKDVFHSVGGFKGKLECNFNFGRNHIMKLIAHAAPPAADMVNGLKQRQFDLFLDGLSFFEFPKLFELGRDHHHHHHHHSVGISSNNTSHDEYKNYSLGQHSHSVEAFHQGHITRVPRLALTAPPSPHKSTSTATVSIQEIAPYKLSDHELIDFSSESVSTATTVQTFHSSVSATQPSTLALAGYCGSSYSSNNVKSRYEPAFVSLDDHAIQLLPYQPDQQLVAQYEILNKYSTAPAPYQPLLTQECSTALVPFTPMAKLTMEPINPFVAYDDAPATEQQDNGSTDDQLSLAMKKMVNFDNIREDSHAKQLQKLSSTTSMNLKDKGAASQRFTPSYVNPNASLAEIQASKGGKQQTRPLVMAAPTNPPQAVAHSAAVSYSGYYGGTTPSIGVYPAAGYGQQHQAAYNNYQFAH